ncbi:hypothetical protein GDO81_007188 [Engystomops pustulosus]|uniref:Uncharacterized protein n=1 Tax=Engystomops pustulosus TaxID=76066 RepID=A0AAV7C711_ENGPU|nr:hypothetical protein GDO81_007188 [Engystomops pustulosus]
MLLGASGTKHAFWCTRGGAYFLVHHGAEHAFWCTRGRSMLSGAPHLILSFVGCTECLVSVARMLLIMIPSEIPSLICLKHNKLWNNPQKKTSFSQEKKK